MMQIVTLTMNPAIDTTAGAERVKPDQKTRCGDPRREPGGGGINVSRAIKRLGGESLAVFPDGSSKGELLKDLLDQEEISTKTFEIKGMGRENITITEKSSDSQYRFVMPGPSISKPEWLQALAILENLSEPPEFIVASGSLPPGVPDDFYGRLAKGSTKLKTKLVVDTGGRPLRLAVDAGIYLIKPNMREMNNLVEGEIEDEYQLGEILRGWCRNKKCTIAAVSLGAGGALVMSEEGLKHYRAPTVPILSKVGAGDSMLAGIVLSLAEGKPVEEAVKFGIAAGAAAVKTPGTELCRREDTHRLYKEINKS